MSSEREGRGWVHVLHQSDISDFDFCLERGRRSYEGITPRVNTDSTILGTAVHAAAEHGLIEKRDREVPHLTELLGVFDATLDELTDQEYVLTKYNSTADLFPIGHKQVTAWLDKVLPQVEPDIVEEEAKRLLFLDDDREVYLEGTADCIDKDGRCWDWKTGEAKYVPWEKQRFAIQPTVYSFLYQWSRPQPWHFRFVLLRPTGKVEYCDVTRTPEDHAWLRERVLSLVTLLEMELPTFPLNDTGWWCSEKWCPAFADCKGAHVHDGWKKARST